jgi:hypothetical protein
MPPPFSPRSDPRHSLMRLLNLACALAVMAAVAGTIAMASGAPAASASPVRSCGNIPETSRHLTIWNVTTRGLRCPKARRAALKMFYCPGRHCRAVGYRFICRNLGRGEAVDMRCVAGRVVVRFQTGV